MESYQQQYLKEMGIDIWVDHNTPVVDQQHLSGQLEPASAINSSAGSLAEQLDALAKRVAVCQQCSLYEGRTQTVFGVGKQQADWLILGEAPGAEEDRQGEPFVGRAGKLLNNMLLAMGLSREQVYITNILKCRPPDNRDPEPGEIVACESYLRKQIGLIKPKIILAVGRVAAQNLLKIDTPIGKMRGKRYQYPDSELPVFVTYHPAYLLRSPREKRKVWDDLKFAMQTFKAIT